MKGQMKTRLLGSEAERCPGWGPMVGLSATTESPWKCSETVSFSRRRFTVPHSWEQQQDREATLGKGRNAHAMYSHPGAGLMGSSRPGTALPKCPRLKPKDLTFAYPSPTDQLLNAGCPQGGDRSLGDLPPSTKSLKAILGDSSQQLT